MRKIYGERGGIDYGKSGHPKTSMGPHILGHFVPKKLRLDRRTFFWYIFSKL
jgi:hypothetical protein